MRRRLLIPALAVFVLLPGAGAARANPTQESTFQDDDHLVYASPADVAHTLDTLKALGVDRIRVSVFWKIVAPSPMSTTKPSFDATDPAAYPAGAWERYDTIVNDAAVRGIGVNLDITDPAPLWATKSSGRADIDATFDPSPQEFDNFVRAVATRYSGTYVPPVVAAAPTDGGTTTSPFPPLPLTRSAQSGQAATRQAPSGAPLPRVSYWSIWNEPNQAGWLTPQWTQNPQDPKQWIEASPQIYRTLVDAGYDALVATGHAKDTILVGETAPKGLLNLTGITRSIDPGRFIRRLYCLDDNLQFEQGTAATLYGCPTSNQAAAFSAAHPGLFLSTGWAHHPYEVTFAPDHKPLHPDWYTTANLSSLSKLLRRVYQRYGQPPPGGGPNVPLYLTEYGYQTNPPDPVGVTPAQQAAFLDESEYMTYRNPLVRTLSQFLLVDAGPLPGYANNSKSVAAWGSTFQSGLVNLDGTHKPAYIAYELPVWVPTRRVHRGSRLSVWGLVRPAAAGKVEHVHIQERGAKGTPYKNVATAKTDGKQGYLTTHLRVLRSGALRLVWSGNPALGTIRSRAVSFTVVKKKQPAKAKKR